MSFMSPFLSLGHPVGAAIRSDAEEGDARRRP
jgi:hypothetical protein